MATPGSVTRSLNSVDVLLHAIGHDALWAGRMVMAWFSTGEATEAMRNFQASDPVSQRGLRSLYVWWHLSRPSAPVCRLILGIAIGSRTA